MKQQFYSKRQNVPDTLGVLGPRVLGDISDGRVGLHIMIHSLPMSLSC